MDANLVKREWATAVMVLMLVAAILVPLLLTGCAQDQYAAVHGDPVVLEVQLRQCKRDAVHEYFQQRGSAGTIAGALLGGPVGGVVGALADDAAGPPPSSINRSIEQCMRERGYEGTSRG